MTGRRIATLSDSFRRALLEDTLPFWTAHAVDREHGGFTTYLDRRGEMLSGDKPMWVQGRLSWLLARLYNDIERRQEWLDLSRHGIEFIRKHGFDADGRVFFAVTRDGRPLRKRRYLFAEIFAILAFAEYSLASGDQAALLEAKRLMDLVHELESRSWGEPGALEPKVDPRTRPMRGHSMTMIQINALQVLRRADPADAQGYDRRIDAQIEDVFRYFVKPEKRALLETVGPDGQYLGDTPEGRCVLPGHAIETAWFIMAEGKHRGNEALARRALPVLDWSLEAGWDPTYGGLLYFTDVEDKQPVQYEWDMKLWWAHNEAIYATLLAHHLTGERKYEQWFDRILRWSLTRFPDRRYGEWFGYLHRDGSVSHDLKGNMWKGPFHLPRMQLFCHLLLEEMKGAA